MDWSPLSTDSLTFWIALLLLAYIHLGYPAAAWLRALVRPLAHINTPIEPTVTVVVVAHNEADRIAARLDNLLALDYPNDKLDIILASDGSTDDTVKRAHRYEEAGVRVHAFHNRRGKAAVLNDVVPSARGEVVVLADARQQFDRGAVRALVADFADRSVGAVSGELVMRPNSARAAVGKGACFYWRYEKFIRRHESRAGSTVGATGAIYAIRRALFDPIPEDTILDDVLIPLRIVRGGYRVLFEPDARAYDGAPATGRQEFVRKVRTIAGTFQLLAREAWVFDPFRNAVWFETISHKALRLTVPVLQILVLLANARLAGEPAYRVVLAGQVLFYLAALAGYAYRQAVRPVFFLSVPYTICLLSWATIIGFVHFVTHRQKATWERVASASVVSLETVAAPGGFDRRRSAR
jgi:biofilm PGA synthesis N-glycosyltransferase PgaC